MEPRLIDVIEEIERRGESTEALIYKTFVVLFLEVNYSIPEERAMQMPIDEVVRLMITPPRPERYRNWDTFYWGKAAFAHD